MASLTLPFEDHLPNGSAADHHVIQLDAGDGIDFKTVFAAQSFEKIDISFTAVAEAVVVADDNRFDADLSDEQISHEFPGGHPGELMIERDDNGGVDAAARDKFELLFMGGDEGRGFLREKAPRWDEG